MAIFTADHVHLRSPDPDAAARYYTGMLGAAPVSRAEVGGVLRVVVDLGGLPLFIEQVPDSTPHLPAPPFAGMEHIALRVEGFDDAVAELTAKGAAFAAPPHQPRPGVQIAFLAAPDGVLIEILERKPA